MTDHQTEPGAARVPSASPDREDDRGHMHEQEAGHEYKHADEHTHVHAKKNTHQRTCTNTYGHTHSYMHEHTHEYGHEHEHEHNHEHEHEHEHEHKHDHEHGHLHHNHSHSHDPKEMRKIINRLSRLIGHLESVKRMIEEGQDCSDVLIQLAAVRSEINGAGKALLKEHLDHCIVEAVREHDEESIEKMNRAIDQFMK